MHWTAIAAKPLKNMVFNFGPEQLISDPTRICETCSSILDLIFTNEPMKYSWCYPDNSIGPLLDFFFFAIRKINKKHSGHKATSIQKVPRARQQNV